MSLPKLAMPMKFSVMSNPEKNMINNDAADKEDKEEEEDEASTATPPTPIVLDPHNNNNNNNITMINNNNNNINTTFMTPFKSLNNSFNKNLVDPLLLRAGHNHNHIILRTIPFGGVAVGLSCLEVQVPCQWG